MILSLCLAVIIATALIPFADIENKSESSNQEDQINAASQMKSISGESDSEEVNIQSNVPQTGDGAMIWCLAAAVCLGIMTLIVSPKSKGQYTE